MQEDLYEAVERNDISTIERLVQQGCDINACSDNYMTTPIGQATSPEIIRRMVELGADVNRKTAPDGVSPLEYAIRFENEDAIHTLIEMGADLHQNDEAGGTLLHVAALHSTKAMVMLLIELGVDPQIPNRRGRTPLEAVRNQLSDHDLARHTLGNAWYQLIPGMNLYLDGIEELKEILQ